MVDSVAARRGRRMPGARAAIGALALAAGLGGVSAAPLPAPVTSAFGVLLSGVQGDSLSGSELALIMGPSMIPTPSLEYAETVDSLFLQPNGFTGQLEVLTTPASPYLLDNSLAAGTQILVEKIEGLIDAGKVDAEHPVTVFGYSQSAAMTTWAMRDLHDAGVPSDFVRFVLIGDSVHPNGGALVALDGMPGLNLADDIPMGNPTPNDLYPTDIYSLEYDGYADFPLYPSAILSTVNALMGMVTQHLAYLGLTPDQIAQATLLESSPDSMINSYMIHSEYVPLLIPLLFMPVTGKLLYDLLEPSVRVLVNMGYGNLDHGWNDGPADVPAKAWLDQPPIDPDELSAALAKGAQDGWDAFSAALVDPATYQYTDVMDIPALSSLVSAAVTAVGATAGDNLTLPQLLDDVFDMVWPSLSGEGMIVSD